MSQSELIERFFSGARIEVGRAMEKFPQPNPTIAALTEEVGELSQALLHVREGKSDGWVRVYEEALQVAAMACRAALEGDPTIGATPPARSEK